MSTAPWGVADPNSLFGLIGHTERLVLRLPEDDDAILRLARVASLGVHPADYNPFASGWSLGTPEQVAARVVEQVWQGRAQSGAPSTWGLPFAVRLKEAPSEPFGSMTLRGDSFLETRTVVTNSWLGMAYQGKGYGTEMRRAVLALAFGHLGARRATTSALHDNAASLGVTRRLGYVETGVVVTGDRECVHFELTERAWLAGSHPPVRWEGVPPAREFLRLDDDPPSRD